MRVAVFTDNDFAKVTGVTTALRALVEYAPPHIHPRIYTCEHQAVDTSGYLAYGARGLGIPYYREMKMYWPPVSRLVQRARTDRISVVHLTTPGPVGLAALHVASRLRVPVVGSFHTDLVAYARALTGSKSLALIMRQYLRLVYGRCERVFAPSEATRTQLAAERIATGKVALWRRGVSTDRFTPVKRSDALRWRWNAPGDTPVLLYVGRLSKEKGLEWLPRLSRRLSGLHLKHRLVLVGDGPIRDSLAQSLPDAVFTGVQSPDDVAVAMASSDIFLFPSRTDTAGNVVLEAQASGLPVVVTNKGGPCEQMVDGVTGRVCGDEVSFEIAAISLIRDLATRQLLAAGARAHALTCQWPVALAPLYQAYADVCMRRESGGSIGAQPALIG